MRPETMVRDKGINLSTYNCPICGFHKTSKEHKRRAKGARGCEIEVRKRFKAVETEDSQTSQSILGD
jgi:hypothetical protein